MKQALKDGAALSIGVDHPELFGDDGPGTGAERQDSLLKDLVF